jgi:hypothetical protein
VANLKHGKSKTKIYGIWLAMRRRCERLNDPAYKDYGARGITVSEEWKLFENFYQDMGEKPEGQSLERIDNNLGYSKQNCVWATRKQQSRNRNNVIKLVVEGQEKFLYQISDETGIPLKTLWYRKKLGWSDEEVAKTPLVTKRKGISQKQKLRYFQGVEFGEQRIEETSAVDA